MIRFCRVIFFIFFLAIVSKPTSSQSKTAIQDTIERLHKQVKEEAYSNTSKALQLAERALTLSKENNLDKEEIQSYYSFGLVYYYKSFYTISNDYYRRVTQSPKSDAKQLSAAWNNMGINYETLGQLDSALYAYQESGKIDRLLGDQRGEYMTLINIGLLNGKLRRFDLAFTQTQKAKTFFQKINDKQNLGLCYMNIGLFYDDVTKADSSLVNYERATNIYKEIEDYPNLFQAYLNLTNFWVSQKNKKKAVENFQKAKAQMEHIDSPFYKASLDAFASLICDNFEQKDSAIFYSLRALKAFDSLGVPEKAKTEYYNLARIYAENGQIKQFRQAFFRFDSLSKELLNQDINNHLAEMEVRYKLDMKNLEIQSTEKLLEEKKLQIWVISLFLLILFIALVFTYRLYARVNQANKNLYRKNVELMGRPIPLEVIPQKEEMKVEENVLLAKFQKLMEEQQLYKRPDLSLKMAAMELGTNEKYLSQAVNTGSDNFNTYVNRFRVNEARRIILEERHNTISMEELGIMVGFTNRHTFSRAFTQIAGISPAEFRKIHLSRNFS